MATATRPWAKEAPEKRQQQQVAFENIVQRLSPNARVVSIPFAIRTSTAIVQVAARGDRSTVYSPSGSVLSAHRRSAC